MEGLSNKGIFLLTMSCVLVVVLGVLYVAPILRKAEPKPECICRSQACPAVVPAVADTSVAPTCPPQPTLEIRKPLSVELDAVVAECKGTVEQADAALQVVLDRAYALMKTARQLNVSSVEFDWLDHPEARTAGTELLGVHWEVQKAADAVWKAQNDCRKKLEALFHAADAWAWVDSEEMDEMMAGAFGFTQAFHEFFAESVWRAECNAVARRLECPVPRPMVPEGDGEEPEL